MLDLRESLDLYDEMNDNVRHHMHSMAEDPNVSDIEMTVEAGEMAAILSLSAIPLLIIEEDPVMLPVYAFMCQNLAKTIAAVMKEKCDEKEEQR